MTHFRFTGRKTGVGFVGSVGGTSSVALREDGSKALREDGSKALREA